MAQRLIRRLCPHCKKLVKIEDINADSRQQITKTIKRISREELVTRVPADVMKSPAFYEPK